MRNRNAHLSANKLLKFDYLLGLRGCGLVIYGALPASLGALGAFKPPDQATLESKVGLAALPYIICVAFIPVILTFVLVRQRLANWYLLPDYLVLRTAIITVGIILMSSLVCGANGLLAGSYRLVSMTAWKNLPLRDKVLPISECLLLSFAYLVGASTLFLTVVKEDGNLPLLPNKTEVDNLTLLRSHLRETMRTAREMARPTSKEQFTGFVTKLKNPIEKATEVLEALQSGFTGLGRKDFYRELSAELISLKDAAQEVDHEYLAWKYYWGEAHLEGLEEKQRERRTNIKKFMGLTIHV